MQFDRRDFLRTSAFAGGFWALGEVTSDALQLAPPGKWPNSPFLQGNYGPVREEIVADRLEVVGNLPRELNGMFVRNGPNPRFAPLGNYHWFDGDGMIHGLHLADGKATYRNRYVRTAAFLAEEKAGHALYGGISDPPTVGSQFKNRPPLNRANTALVWHDGRLLALWEGGPPHEVKVPSLETVGPHTYQGKLKHAFTAHPKVDPATGEMILFGYNLVMRPFVHHSVVNAKGEMISTTPIELKQPVMMHDFAVTASKSIFMDLPEVFDLSRAMKGQHPLVFQKERGSRFGVLPRHGQAKEIRWFESPSCFVFHTLNAYDEGDEVVLLACRMPEFPSEVSFGGDSHPSDRAASKPLEPILYEWRFNLKTGGVKEGPRDDRTCEFPRINDDLAGRKTRYGYAGCTDGGTEFSGFLKYDLERGGSKRISFGSGRTGGEGVFVARPGGKAEDEGWLLTFVHDRATNKSELFIADAASFDAEPVARVKLPVRVPYGFHGQWLDGKLLG